MYEATSKNESLPEDDEYDEEIDEIQDTLTQPKKNPTGNDYFAGAMLANGIVWVWMQALSLFRAQTSSIPLTFLADISFVVYIFGAYLAVSQVGKRTDTGHLIVGLKTAIYSWVMAIVIMFTMAAEPTFSLAIVLLVCFLAGGILGGYMLVRKRLKERRKNLEASS
jgi:hypothetical protein